MAVAHASAGECVELAPGLCPLFDAHRALRDQLGENPLPGLTFEINLGPTLTALLRGDPPAPPGDYTDWQVPDFPPQHWIDGNS